MAQKQAKSRLGKGIASLIQSTSSESLKGKMDIDKILPPVNVPQRAPVIEHGPLMVAVSDIKVNELQPRKIFKERELDELARSIKENGIIQPLVVKKIDVGFELIAGERRLRASRRAGLEQVPVILKNVTDKEKLVLAIIENVQRSDLNCVEEALAYYQLMEEFRLTQEEVAKKIGKERSTIANFLRILKLPRAVVELLQKEELSFGHGKVLAAVKEPERASRLASETASEGYSVRELEALIKKRAKPVSEKSNPFFDERLDSFKGQLEKKTGFHFDLNSKKNGKGHITIKYNDEAEFNDIYEYLMSNR
ncbi:MAG: ParB/RepB/Spo0J family partition protein [Bacteriovoracaceae bacterium]|jgi:ParB family transcriptional regulator, chromosome partitioning protein|nr:ParB/RepB/Spo0J family partition protein [Bacteriovoracaceae bacterium]